MKALAMFSAFLFVATPIGNTIVRAQEIEAEVELKLTKWRKPDPGPIEEFVFFDHPSTRHRIHDAMQWREAMGTP